MRKIQCICGPEASLGGNMNEEQSSGTLIQKRAIWPVAEYSCKFMVDGSFFLVGFEIINLDRYGAGRGEPDFQEPFVNAMPDWLER
eukprot:15340112-Ditylum_brightwellii.AAC.1